MAEAVLSFRLVTTDQQLEALVPAWHELLADSAQAGPMLEPCWLVTWWRHYGRGRALACGVFEAEGRLVGLAPFCLRSHSYGRLLAYRRLEFLGSTANEPDAVCSEYLDLIARRGFEDVVVTHCARALMAGEFGVWQECVLEAMDGAAIGHQLLRRLGNLGARFEASVSDTAPYVELPTDWNSYLASLPKKRRQSLKYALRDFEAWASSGYALHRATDAGSLAEGMAHLVALHGERWRKDNHRGAFAAQRFLGFQTDYAALALALGQLDLVWVTVAGEPVAVQYNLLGRDKIYFYQSGRKIGVPRTVRLGIVMLIFALQNAIAKGYREFDFLGGESAYKRLLATNARPLVVGRVARPTVIEHALQAARQVARSVRRLRIGLRPEPGQHATIARGLAYISTLITRP